MNDHPLMFLINLCNIARTPSSRYIISLMATDNFYSSGVEQLKQAVLTSTKSKLQAYAEMNPEMKVSGVYTETDSYVPEQYRVQYTRLRLVSHNLRIETGRWARLPRDQRLCRYGQVQMEKHVD